MQDDSSLRAAFDALRRDEAARAPSFQQLLAEPRPRTPMWRPVLVAGSAVALLAAVWISTSVLQEPEAMPDLCSIGAWHTPTDVLLETPGRELLRDLPHFADPSRSIGS